MKVTTISQHKFLKTWVMWATDNESGNGTDIQIPETVALEIIKEFGFKETEPEPTSSYKYFTEN